MIDDTAKGARQGIASSFERTGREAHAVRVSKNDGAVGAGRACGQSQASVSAVSGERLGDEDPAEAVHSLDGRSEQPSGG